MQMLCILNTQSAFSLFFFSFSWGQDRFLGTCRICIHIESQWEKWYLQLWGGAFGAFDWEATNWGRIWRWHWYRPMGATQNPDKGWCSWSIGPKNGWSRGPTSGQAWLDLSLRNLSLSLQLISFLCTSY